MPCKAYQTSDSMNCDECDLYWDANDPDPPACRQQNTGRAQPAHSTKHSFSPACPEGASAVLSASSKEPVRSPDKDILDCLKYLEEELEDYGLTTDEDQAEINHTYRKIETTIRRLAREAGYVLPESGG